MSNDSNFIVYKSSAGSGKTYTLVREYLRIALGSQNPHRYKGILAVTFTNKAASEMKYRVLSVLKELEKIPNHSSKNEGLVTELCTTLELEPSELKNRASGTLNSILHHFSDYNILTIDKFILRVIRSFSIDFKLPVNFEVELDTDGYLEKAIDQLLAEIGNNPELTSFLLQYIHEQTSNDKSFDIARTLKTVAKELLGDESTPYTAQLKKKTFQDFLNFKKQLQEVIREYEDQILGKKEHGMQILQDASLEAEDFKGKSRGSIFAYFFSESEKLVYESTAPTTQKYFEAEDWKVKTNCAQKNEAIERVRDSLYPLYLKIETAKEEQLPHILGAVALGKNIFEVALLQQIDQELAAIRSQENFIHISEFNQKVSEIVLQQPIPFIYERVGEKFKNYLIDEFQDTSELQWYNLMPLVENALAYGETNLIVGDVKQAIYRFRGGKVDQFQYIGDPEYRSQHPLIDERLTSIRRQLQAKSLQNNYRSLPEIINFNNLFFDRLLDELGYDFKSLYYEDFKQIPASRKSGGYVKVQAIDAQEEDLNEINYALTKETILKLRDNGRPFQDITILCRRNKKLKTLSYLLAKDGFPILSSEGLSLDMDPTCNFLVNFVRLSHHSSDLKSAVACLEHLFTISSETVSEMKSASSPLHYVLHKTTTDLGLIPPKISRFNLYEALEELIKAFNINKKDAFVQRLLEIALDKSKDGVQDFLHWWEEKKHKLFISSPENIDAIQLMTVHKSKGLEFPVVIYPFADYESRSGFTEQKWVTSKNLSKTLEVGLVNLTRSLEKTTFNETYQEHEKASLLDDLNTTYVALTRAVEEMYIFAQPPKEIKDKKRSLNTFFYPLLKDEENHSYECGTPLIKKTLYQEKSAVESAHQSPKSQWYEKVKLSFSAQKNWEVPADSEQPYQIPKSSRARGNMLHFVLSQIQEAENWPYKLEELKQRGIIDSTELEDAKSVFTALFDHNEFITLWKSGHHHIERDLLLTNNQVLRPDRLIINEDRIILIDFKTGTQEKSHRKQILEYKSVLETIFNKPIIPLLVYLDPLEIKKL